MISGALWATIGDMTSNRKTRKVPFLVCLFLGWVCLGAPVRAQQLEGRWQGMMKSPQGERQATVTIRKEGETYLGSISGIGGTTELPLKEIRREGDRVIAKMQIDAPQGAITVNFDFVLKGDTLAGKGEANVGAQVLNFTYEMKRLGDVLAKQEVDPARKLDYFLGEWSFEMVARESPFGPAGNLTGTLMFSPVLDNRFLESRLDCKADTGPFQKSGFAGWDPGSKSYTFFDSVPGGIATMSSGAWVGPAIRIESAPVRAGGKTFHVRRVLSIISDNSFSVRDEFSVDGGPFQRLGNGTFSRTSPAPGKPAAK